jgi:hypothetical protein
MKVCQYIWYYLDYGSCETIFLQGEKGVVMTVYGGQLGLTGQKKYLARKLGVSWRQKRH